MCKSSSALGLGVPEIKKHAHALFDGAPRFFPKKCRFCPTRHAFWGKPWGAVKKSVSTFFSSGPPSPNAELDLHAGIFEKLSVGPSYAAFRTVNDVQNVENWVRVNPKMGSIFRCSPKYLIFWMKNYMDMSFLLSDMI